MGISLGGAKSGAIAEVNVVPLIDILLVLLVIFMVIRPATQFGLPVDLPQQISDGTKTPGTVIVVQVFEDGTLRINRDPVSWQDLQSRLVEIFRPRESRVAFVRGDGALEFGVIARAIDVMRASGIETVGLMTPELANAR
ncbi:MAG TPA: biopolymer transporter ExbD [Candidatus Acidoferrum sp.]|nr:biopolymer transporter ExbD [Candidatus Acidoferrum sp.]